MIVSIWTKLHNKLRVKITNTVFWAFFLLVIISLSWLQTQLDNSDYVIEVVARQEVWLLNCLDVQPELAPMLDYCLIPYVADLRDTYDME